VQQAPIILFYPIRSIEMNLFNHISLWTHSVPHSHLSSHIGDDTYPQQLIQRHMKLSKLI